MMTILCVLMAASSSLWADIIIEGPESKATIIYLDSKIVVEESGTKNGKLVGKPQSIGQLQEEEFRHRILKPLNLEGRLAKISITEITREIETTRTDIDSDRLNDVEILEARYYLKQLETAQIGLVQAEKDVFQYLNRDKVIWIRSAYQKSRANQLWDAIKPTAVTVDSKGISGQESQNREAGVVPQPPEPPPKIDSRVLCAPIGEAGFLPTRVSDGRPIGFSNLRLGLRFEVCEILLKGRVGDVICSVVGVPYSDYEFAPFRISDGTVIGLSQRGMSSWENCSGMVKKSRNGLVCAISGTVGTTNHFVPFRVKDNEMVGGQKFRGYLLEFCEKAIENSTEEFVCSRVVQGDGTSIFNIETAKPIGIGSSSQSFRHCVSSMAQLKH